MTKLTRPISWIRAVLKNFNKFPLRVRADMLDALTIAADGGKADNAKPMPGLGSGVFEIVVDFNKDTFRTVYELRIGTDIWVIHAFKKKSTIGIKTPKRELDVAKERIARLEKDLN